MYVDVFRCLLSYFRCDMTCLTLHKFIEQQCLPHSKGQVLCCSYLLIISWTIQLPLNKVCHYSTTTVWQQCDGLFNVILKEKGFLTLWQERNISVTGRYGFAVSPLLSSSSPLRCRWPPGFPRRAKTNNSAKQGSIRPGSSVTLASHLPGRGLTSQAASRALSWTSSA